LLFDDGLRLAGIALTLCFPHADDRFQAGANSCHGLAANLVVGFSVIGPAFGMADNDILRARVCQHAGRDVAGVSARPFGMTVLAADQYA
jgi:hypothetical protein